MTVTAPPPKKIRLQAKDLAGRKMIYKHPGGELNEADYGKWYNTATFKYDQLTSRAKVKAIKEFGNHVETWDSHDSDWITDHFANVAKERGYNDAQFSYSVGFCQSDHLSLKSADIDYKVIAKRLMPEAAAHVEALVAEHAQDLWGVITMEESFPRDNGNFDVAGSCTDEPRRIGCKVSVLSDGGDLLSTYPYLVPLLDEMFEEDDYDRGAEVIECIGPLSACKLRYVSVTIAEFVTEFAEKLAAFVNDDVKEMTSEFYGEFSDSILEAGSERAIKDRLEGDDWYDFRVDGTIPGKRNSGEWWH